MSQEELISLDNFLSAGKSINSPRSLDVLYRLGLDEDELRPVDIEAFYEIEPDEDLASEMYSHSEANRKKKMKAAQSERNDCIRLMEMMNQEGMSLDVIMKNYRTSDGSFLPPSLLREKVKRLERFQQEELQQSTSKSGGDNRRSKSMLKNQGSTLLEAEEHRLELLRKKQEREISALISSEVQRAEIERQNAEKIRAEEEKMRSLEKDKERRRLEIQEKLRQEELKKKEKEDAELAAIRQKFLEDYREQQEKLRQAKIKEHLEQKEKRMKEEEEINRQEQFQQETIARLKKKDDEIMAKKLRMEAEEEERERHCECERQRAFEQLRKKREQMKLKIEQAKERNEKLEHDRKAAYYEKQKRFEERQEKERQEKERQKQEEKRQREERAMKLKKAYDDARLMEEMRCKSILDKDKEREEYMKTVKQKQDKDLSLRKVRSSMREMEKWENVERHQRELEVQKQMTLEKIQKDDERSNEIQTAKQKLMEERRKQLYDAMKQKHEIHEAMEKLRVTNSFAKFQRTMDSLGMTKSRENTMTPGRNASLPSLHKTV